RKRPGLAKPSPYHDRSPPPACPARTRRALDEFAQGMQAAETDHGMGLAWPIPAAFARSFNVLCWPPPPPPARVDGRIAIDDVSQTFFEQVEVERARAGAAGRNDRHQSRLRRHAAAKQSRRCVFAVRIAPPAPAARATACQARRDGAEIIEKSGPALAARQFAIERRHGAR